MDSTLLRHRAVYAATARLFYYLVLFSTFVCILRINLITRSVNAIYRPCDVCVTFKLATLNYVKHLPLANARFCLSNSIFLDSHASTVRTNFGNSFCLYTVT